MLSQQPSERKNHGPETVVFLCYTWQMNEEQKALPKEILTLSDLIAWLEHIREVDGDLMLDIRYDSGYGYGYITPSSFAKLDNKMLQILLS